LLQLIKLIKCTKLLQYMKMLQYIIVKIHKIVDIYEIDSNDDVQYSDVLYSILIISRLYCVYITTLTVRRHKCHFLVAFMYVGGVYKHRLRFM
jgi:hypothetical protein